jgi:hypothetical protein
MSATKTLRCLAMALFALESGAPAWCAGFAWPFSGAQTQPAPQPATGFAFPGFPPAAQAALAPYRAAPFGFGATSSPFAMFPGSSSPMGGFGGASMNSMLSPMMSGAMSIAMPIAGNYAIASMNPTTFSNFIGLTLRPQTSPFGSPFGGGFFSRFPMGGMPGFGASTQPATPFSFFPGFGR